MITDHIANAANTLAHPATNVSLILAGFLPMLLAIPGLFGNVYFAILIPAAVINMVLTLLRRWKEYSRWRASRKGP